MEEGNAYNLNDLTRLVTQIEFNLQLNMPRISLRHPNQNSVGESAQRVSLGVPGL